MTGYNQGDNGAAVGPTSAQLYSVLGTVVYDVSYFIGTSHLVFYGCAGTPWQDEAGVIVKT